MTLLKIKETFSITSTIILKVFTWNPTLAVSLPLPRTASTRALWSKSFEWRNLSVKSKRLTCLVFLKSPQALSSVHCIMFLTLQYKELMLLFTLIIDWFAVWIFLSKGFVGLLSWRLMLRLRLGSVRFKVKYKKGSWESSLAR